MSDEQGIRDDIERAFNEWWNAPHPDDGSDLDFSEYIMPLIRRIQAEAGAGALRSYRTRLMDQNIDRFGIVLPDLHEVLDDLDEEADRIERGETA